MNYNEPLEYYMYSNTDIVDFNHPLVSGDQEHHSMCIV